MLGLPTSFWAKLQQREAADGTKSVCAWHSLEHHCADVAACCFALLESTILRQRLAHLGGLDDLQPIQVARLGFLAALHDFGKANHGFQNKAWPTRSLRAGHVKEALALIGGNGFQVTRRFYEALPLAALDQWSLGGRSGLLELLLAAVCHHGRPYSIEIQPECRLWDASDERDPIRGIQALLEAAHGWFPTAFEPGSPLPDSSAFQHAFCGLVTLADWLGSDSERFFPFSDDAGSDRFPEALERARRALRLTGINSQLPQVFLSAERVRFDHVSPYPPRAAQQLFLDLPTPSAGSLAVLEAETGSGKTEAALLHFARLFRAGVVDGLYFALPTRTAATQIHRRTVEALERLFPEAHSRPAVIQAVPGYITADRSQGSRIDPSGCPLPSFQVLWTDDSTQALRERGWAAEQPKRYLAGCVVVGTIDQVLLSALGVDHAHLRASALLRHLLVVDEVHASDSYMTRLLESVLEHHLAAGGHALLMSATLGSEARERLERWPGQPKRDRLRLAQARLEPYPALRWQAPGEAMPPLVPAGASPEKEVTLEIVPELEDPSLIAELALRHARAGARVLVLRNTVKGCVAVQGALEERAEVLGCGHLLFTCQGLRAPHHARFAREDRALLDNAVEAAFGKGSAPGPRIAITTQTCEQSLDLDVDLLLTDLCPVDVLLQRIGRLHRHAERHRPPGYERPRVLVLVPAERDLSVLMQANGEVRGGSQGLGSVYDDLRVLEATWRLAAGRPSWTIPRDNRELVELATHREALSALVAELGGKWRQHEARVVGSVFAERQLADLNLVDWSLGFSEAYQSFPDPELWRRVPTRLGLEDRVFELVAGTPSPFGSTLTKIVVPAHLAQGLPTDASCAAEPSGPGVLKLHVADRVFLYDRWGLRPFQRESDHE
jgi:CRISPR-associated endonuclease/helicase Cas3